MRQLDRHHQGEPSNRSLGVHLAMFTVLAITLAIMITIRPFEMRLMQATAVLVLLAALVASGWFLTRSRFDVVTDPGDTDS